MAPPAPRAPDAPPRLPGFLAWPYALYAGLLFTILGLLALLLMLPVPWLTGRRQIARNAGRLFLFLAGMPLAVRGAERFGEESWVVVANHSSYLDGVVLCAALPPRFGFVIKREMSRVPLANLLLRRIGAQYVDRGQGNKGARDTRKLLKRAKKGRSLAFFPEGTFQRQAGLMKFRSGAFLVSARVNMNLLPVAIRGTRRALPPGTLMPRPGPIRVDVLEPVPAPGSTADEGILTARDACRAAILACTGEPDLARDG